MQHYIVQHNQCLYHAWYKHWLCTPHTWSSVWGVAWLHPCCVITVCMHEGASICQTVSYDIYIQGISHACRSVIIIISGKLYYHIPGISGMLASVCVSTLSSNSYNYSLNQPAILCIPSVDLGYHIHKPVLQLVFIVANSMLLTSAHAGHQCSLWSNVSHEPIYWPRGFCQACSPRNIKTCTCGFIVW